MPNYFLEQTDVTLLQRLLDEARSRRWDLGVRNDRNRDEEQASDCYIATLDTWEGIDGLNHAVQGYSGPRDIPGYALCDVYEVKEGILRAIAHQVPVYNLSEERIRNDWFTVSKSKGGDWVINNKTVIVDGILYKKLDPATGPLTGATVGYAVLLEWEELEVEDFVTGEYTPAKWKTTERQLRFVNRSMSMQGQSGTYGKFVKSQGEFNPLQLDCTFSQEGVNLVINVFSDTYGGFAYGG